jgi:hypothetical protein
MSSPKLKNQNDEVAAQTTARNQELYLEALSERIGHILTDKQKNRYCLIFGYRVVGEYDTLLEATSAQVKDFSFALTVLYVPNLTEIVA